MTRLRILGSTFACCPPGKPGFIGGEDILGWNLVKQIARYHDLTILTAPWNHANILSGLEDESISTVRVHPVHLPRILSRLLRIQGGHQIYYYLWQFWAYFIARKLQRQAGFDIFHHITYGNDWMASYIGALLPIPYIRGPGGGAHRTPKSLAKEYPVGVRIWEKIRIAGQWLFRHDPIYFLGHNRAKSILVCNPDSLAAVPKRWKSKTQLYPVNGVSSSEFIERSRTTDKSSTFTVVSAGTLLRLKGFNLAIRAFHKFSEEHPDAIFRIFGDGPEKARIESLINKLDLSRTVKLHDAIPRDELMSQMAAADAFLFPSLRDGGGAVVVEAMASGTPVICLDAGGPGMHITPDCGIKIEPQSPEITEYALANALHRLSQHPDIRDKMGKAARDRAWTIYRWDKLGERMMEIYEQATSLNRST